MFGPAVLGQERNEMTRRSFDHPTRAITLALALSLLAPIAWPLGRVALAAPAGPSHPAAASVSEARAPGFALQLTPDQVAGLKAAGIQSPSGQYQPSGLGPPVVQP
jgi:hypothetical protein